MTKTAIMPILLALAGCSSVGDITYNQSIHSNDYVTITAPTPARTSDCPRYTPLPPFNPPDVPLEKLRSALDKNDHEVIIELTKYIRELRESISKRKKENIQHYENYSKSCAQQLK